MLPENEKEPASVLSARRAVNVAVVPDVAAALPGVPGAAAGGGACDADKRLKPHDMQNRTPMGFTWLHCGHDTSRDESPAGAVGGDVVAFETTPYGERITTAGAAASIFP